MESDKKKSVFLKCTACIFLVLFVIGVTTYTNFKHNKQQITQAQGATFVGKLTNIIDEHFDTFFALSGEEPLVLGPHDHPMLKAKELLLSNFLNEEDKKIFQKHVDKVGTGHTYVAFLGVKDGKEIMYLVVNSSSKSGGFTFESNLPFTYDSVIKEFERLSGTELTQEFLTDCTRNKVLDQPNGILFHLVPNADKTAYIFVFWANINGQIYITSPDLIKAGVLY
ncbi:MAG: hypothetical protein IJA76_00305 [Clostridia bacterium]|nr:hypothetical protein [Clostridia bacterium]MBQ4587364.1 hypothetical protein [Clostridia bacterium]